MILLSVTFNSQTLRHLALNAVIKEYGEDGWAAPAIDDNPEGKMFPATIVCSEVQDAVETWSQLFTAFANVYNAILDPEEIKTSYKLE